MSDLRTAAQQALEALGKWSSGRDIDAVQLNDLIATLESALEQPEQAEPVAWMLPRTDSIITAATKVYRGVLAEDYTQPLYANPPSREWRGLTDTERAAVQYESFKRGLTPLEFMELHEAALRSKNHD
jgi:hypothetical protein